MYTTQTTTREFALKAAAAAERAMERQACCKSQFKFKCFSCGEMINRGDSITSCIRAATGMELRYRGADNTNGLTMGETAFYQAKNGPNMWVHIGCNPCYWDEGFDNGDESSPPGLRGVPTEWGCKVDREFEDWTSGPGGEAWLTMGVPYFLKVKGYPKEKSMKKRIVQSLTRFQAIWRGCLYKRAYPEALLQAQVDKDEVINGTVLEDVWKEVDAALAYRQQTCWEEEWQDADIFREKRLWSGEGGKNEREKVDERHAQRRRVRARNGFLSNNSIGAHVEVLMDEGRSRAAIYSAEVIKIQGLPEIDGLYYWVKYHDGEVRRYHWKRLLLLKLECETFKSKHGILAKIIGKLPVYVFSL